LLLHLTARTESNARGIYALEFIIFDRQVCVIVARKAAIRGRRHHWKCTSYVNPSKSNPGFPGLHMQKEVQSQVSQLLQQAEVSTRHGEREKAYQISLEATSAAPNEPLAWYLRSRNAPSLEEQLMCLSRAFALDPRRTEAKADLRTALQELLKKEPFLAYVYETQELYQVRSGRDLLINIPKNRGYETPYLQRDPGPVKPAYRWLYFAVIGLLFGGVGAVLLAPIAVFQVLRLLTMSLTRSDRVRAWVIFILSVVIWSLSIPVSWLLLIRLLPA
jgi:hypothetical protein